MAAPRPLVACLGVLPRVCTGDHHQRDAGHKAQLAGRHAARAESPPTIRQRQGATALTERLRANENGTARQQLRPQEEPRWGQDIMGDAEWKARSRPRTAASGLPD
jgi:hypothetical protein